MDNVIKLLMERYGLNREQAIAYAKSVVSSGGQDAAAMGPRTTDWMNARTAMALNPTSGPQDKAAWVASRDKLLAGPPGDPNEIQMPPQDVNDLRNQWQALINPVNVPPPVSGPAAFARGAYAGYAKQSDYDSTMKYATDPAYKQKYQDNVKEAAKTFSGSNRKDD